MIEPDSRTWRAIQRFADDEIEKSRVRLEAPGTPLEATEFERGRVRALRDVLALAAPRSYEILPTDLYEV